MYSASGKLPKCISVHESSGTLCRKESEFNPSNLLRMTPFSRFSNWNVFIPGKNNMYFRELV